MIASFSATASRAIRESQDEAKHAGSPEIKVHHLFTSLVNTVDGELRDLLELRGVTVENLRRTFSTPIASHQIPSPTGKHIPYSSETHKILDESVSHNMVAEPGHVLREILRNPTLEVASALEQYGVTHDLATTINRQLLPECA